MQWPWMARISSCTIKITSGAIPRGPRESVFRLSYASGALRSRTMRALWISRLYNVSKKLVTFANYETSLIQE